MLELKKVNASYGSVQVLKNVSLRVETGNLVAIVGPKGGGKSTLLKIISGVIEFQKGRIRYQGIDLLTHSPAKNVALGISLVPEGRRLFPQMTVLENLRLGAYFYDNRKFKAEIREQLQRVYTFFPILQKHSHQWAGTLNAGAQQMLAIGRALMARPNLLLLDEPSLGLAPEEVKAVFEVIRRINEQGITILLAEQNARAAVSLARYGYVLEAGKVSYEGPVQDFLSG